MRHKVDAIDLWDWLTDGTHLVRKWVGPRDVRSARAEGASMERKMTTFPKDKYRPFPPIDLPGRRWPSRTIETAPRWCSVDLRDGNQALIEPMGSDRKLRLFSTLIGLGFKEIEVGFPSASQTDYDFLRRLIDEDRIPEDVTIQVLTQAREHLIRRTMEALQGARRAIVHVYNSTSTVQREVVFGLDRAGVIDLAKTGTKMVADLVGKVPDTEIVLEYSPESFTGTELGFAVEVCEAVMEVWKPTPDQPIILNLPATVEMATPNVYADQIEWFGAHLQNRSSAIISVHPHNDRGTAVAAAELALMAGADRVEGTLFGNGERTGNVDVLTLALNMLTQGVDPKLKVDDINEIVRVSEHCTRLPVHPRHPYAGELVFTAFSGSHQDAIKKGLKRRELEGGIWEVPYLPIDPADLGRTYEAVIRINSQSGKGGVAYILETDYGLRLPRRLQIAFSKRIQAITDNSEKELSSKEVFSAFEETYLSNLGPVILVNHALRSGPSEEGSYEMTATIREDEEDRVIQGRGNGPISAFFDALRTAIGFEARVTDYSEHSLGKGADAIAVAYVEVTAASGRSSFGVGRHANLVTASLQAVVRALNRVGFHAAGERASA